MAANVIDSDSIPVSVGAEATVTVNVAKPEKIDEQTVSQLVQERVLLVCWDDSVKNSIERVVAACTAAASPANPSSVLAPKLPAVVQPPAQAPAEPPTVPPVASHLALADKSQTRRGPPFLGGGGGSGEGCALGVGHVPCATDGMPGNALANEPHYGRPRETLDKHFILPPGTKRSRPGPGKETLTRAEQAAQVNRVWKARERPYPAVRAWLRSWRSAH